MKVAQWGLLFATPWAIPHGMLQARIRGWVAVAFSRGIFPTPGIKPRPPVLQADSLPAEPPGKPKNTGVGSLSLLQQIFPTQESNQGLLRCRWILYPSELSGKPLQGIGSASVLCCSFGVSFDPKYIIQAGSFVHGRRWVRVAECRTSTPGLRASPSQNYEGGLKSLMLGRKV